MKRLLICLLLFVNLLSCKAQDYIDWVNPTIKYGALYNWYAANDSRGFVAGWHVPTNDEINLLINYTGGMSSGACKLKATGYVYWSSPNTGATNEYGFNGRGGGARSYDGTQFYQINQTHGIFSITLNGLGNAYVYQLQYNSIAYFSTSMRKTGGMGIRLIKNDNINTGSVIIDGITYPTVKIGNQVWMAYNLIATHYANGDPIQYVTDNSTWGSLTTGAYCYYNNDIKNK